jgi:hypothetical protein
MKSKHYILSMITLAVAVFSIGMTTTLLNTTYAQEQKFTASLSGDQEVPPNTSTAKGWAWFKPMSDSVWFKVNVTGIDKVTMAHIHSGKKGENGEVVVVLFKADSPTGPMSGTLAQGNFTAADLKGPMTGKTIKDLVTAMQNGETYANVHTEANPKGEIRGQIEMANTTMMSNSSAMIK